MRDSFKSYRDLEVWQKSMVLAKEVYQVTSSFPADEKFGLINQIVEQQFPSFQILRKAMQDQEQRNLSTSYPWPSVLWRNWKPRFF